MMYLLLPIAGPKVVPIIKESEDDVALGGQDPAEPLQGGPRPGPFPTRPEDTRAQLLLGW